MPFIRQGVWCACESSFNSSSNILEQGVSVYACDGAASDGWVPTGDAWDKNGSAARRALDRELGSEWFLVEGATLEALGADREPLLRKVTFISRLTWNGASGRFFEATGDQPEIRTHATHTQQSYEDIYNAMYGDDDEDEDDDGIDDDAVPSEEPVGAVDDAEESSE